mmetsp:Transcript_28223/g.32390  ORF Transcript_28223/g.32390 Transcript_28223/m.32390 type:complete len:115 (-) Transcript_28223:1136-1480(-)
MVREMKKMKMNEMLKETSPHVNSFHSRSMMISSQGWRILKRVRPRSETRLETYDLEGLSASPKMRTAIRSIILEITNLKDDSAYPMRVMKQMIILGVNQQDWTQDEFERKCSEV